MNKSETNHWRNLGGFVKYDSIANIDEVYDIEKSVGNVPVKVFEKLDGGNCQISNLNQQLRPGSRSNYLKGPKIDRVAWFRRFVDWTYSNSSLYNLSDNLIIFGEWLGNHTIEYPQEVSNKFYVIDLFDRLEGVFFDYNETKERIERLGIEKVHFLDVLHDGPFNDALASHLLLDEGSNYYAGPKEGLVVKDYLGQHFWKILHPEFDEVRRTVFEDEDGEKIPRGQFSCRDCKPGAEKTDIDSKDYLTPARFRKAFHRVKERDLKKRTVSLEDLVSEVIRDVRKERHVDYSSEQVRIVLDRFSSEGLLRGIGKLIRNK